MHLISLTSGSPTKLSWSRICLFYGAVSLSGFGGKPATAENRNENEAHRRFYCVVA